MFATIIKDAYKKNEAKEIAEALSDICDPSDSYGWASAGIYVFWDYYTNEILYLGLAVDLAERFKQHNGLIKVDEKSCKINEIRSYFEQKEKLGFSVLVQSSLSQPITAKNKKLYQLSPEQIDINDFTSSESREHLKIVEGILIEAFNIIDGKKPAWNKISGSIEGQDRAKEDNKIYLDSFVKQEGINPLVARCTLRELSINDFGHCWYEECLHGVRLTMLTQRLNFYESFELKMKMQPKIFAEIKEKQYFNRQLDI